MKKLGKLGMSALVGSITLFVGCLESHSPVPDHSRAEEPSAPVDGFVLRDPDNKPVRIVPVELLQDIRRQMLEKGLAEDARYLEEAYDFSTGKLKAQ